MVRFECSELRNSPKS